MAELATIARPYAEALFRVAKAGSLAAWSDLVDEMAQVAAHPELKALAQNPTVSHAKLVEVFAAAVKTPLAVEAQNFVKTLVDNGRLTVLPQIAEQFHELKNAQEGSADAHIVSAFEMSEAQVKDLMAKLEKKFSRKLNASVTVDSSLIGGVRVVVGDEVFDTSVRAKLEQLHAALAA